MFKEINNPIIPIDQTFYDVDTKKIIQWEISSNYTLDLEAISNFVALGFMLEDSTYYKEVKVINPATQYIVDGNDIINKKETNWDWHYQPRDISFVQVLDQFTELFNKIVEDRIKDRKILLPISGGLDSRTLFVATKDKSNLTLSSYEFEGGVSESEAGTKLSEHFNIPFYSQKIQNSYLWHRLDEISQMNKCFSDFTHPRQVAVINQWKELGDTILLGHWGDVLFEKQADSDNISYDEQVIQLKKKILISGGVELAADLWRHWGFECSFETYMTDKLDRLYRKINIDHPSARVRAFKSLYWAPRWTSINLSVFNRLGKLVLPYYNDEMCKFICTIPERYLKGRKIQIEYIKKYCPDAAKIPWQKYYPLNLYQYQWFNHPVYYPVRGVRKLKRLINSNLLKSSDLITRNWELQFLGTNNFHQIKKQLANLSRSSDIIPQKIIDDYLGKFQGDPVKYAHPLSMLLTLSVFIGIQHQQ